MTFIIHEDVLRHIMRRHGNDLRKIIGIQRLEELRSIVEDVINNPSEAHQDIHNPSVRYYLRRLNDLWLNVVIQGNEVETAYIISTKSYNKFKTGRWM